jgi:putative ABC transport system permease protein
MFGIVWGIVSIVILSAASEGFQRGNQQVLEQTGKNMFILRNGRTSLQAGGSRAGRPIRLTMGDLQAIRQHSRLLESISPDLTRPDVKIKSPFNSNAYSVTGIWPVYQQIRSLELTGGRQLRDMDCEQARRVAVIGFDVAKQLFADRNPIGSNISLNGVPYTVIGSAKRKSESSSAGQDDNRIFVPYEAMRKDFPLPDESGSSDALSAIIASPYDWVIDEMKHIVEVEGKIDLETGGPVESELRTILGARRDFSSQDTEAVQIINTSLNSVFLGKLVSSIKEFFVTVSFVTLALGGIGIMNIMLIAVKERTREIGVRKALGATPQIIQWQFFNEGMFLTLASGMIGLFTGVGLCALINLMPMPARFAGMIVTWQTGIMALLALVLIGVGAATYPARRAAALPPIEALRFEM